MQCHLTGAPCPGLPSSSTDTNARCVYSWRCAQHAAGTQREPTWLPSHQHVEAARQKAWSEMRASNGLGGIVDDMETGGDWRACLKKAAAAFLGAIGIVAVLVLIVVWRA